MAELKIAAQRSPAANKLRQIYGCQMVYFQTKNPNLGKFWRVLLWKVSVFCFTYFMAIISWSFGKYIFHFGSGNPGHVSEENGATFRPRNPNYRMPLSGWPDVYVKKSPKM
jgi:hypothetical protein